MNNQGRGDSDRLDTARAGTADPYAEPLKQLWTALTSYLGEASAAAILHSALRDATLRYSFLRHIRITEDGVLLNGFMQELPRLDTTTVQAGLASFADDVASLLSDLTGEVVVRRVEPLLQRFKDGLGRI